MTAAVAERTTVEARSERLRAAAERAGLDAVVATNPASIAYLTGFGGLQLERLFAVCLPVAGGGALVVPRLDEEAAEAAPSGLEVVGYDASSDGLPELLAALGPAERLGVEEHHLNVARARALASAGREVVPAGELVMALRAVKDEVEVERIRRACALVAAELERLFRELRPGDVEREANARIEHRLREQGAAETYTLVLFGPNGSNPHGSPGERRLAAGDVVCADVSARLDGYWGDLTRCATVGPPSDWARAAWDVVREAQAAAIDTARVGVAARDVDRAQREIVEASSDIGRCLHGAGHAIGAEVHEPPYLVPRTETLLEGGMVFTIEPGIYRAGVGGVRLEDDVLVTANEPVLLSDLPLELREITT